MRCSRGGGRRKAQGGLLSCASAEAVVATNDKVCWSNRWRWRTCNAISKRGNVSDILPSLHSPHRPRPPPLNRIRRIIDPRRRRMAAGHQPVHQRFVLGGEAIVERADVIVPLFFGAGAGAHA